MPELPEVEALRRSLSARLLGSRVASIELGSLSALKTVRPSPADLTGGVVSDVQRRGKLLALAVEPAADRRAYLVWHLARAGWVKWRDEIPATPLRPGKTAVAMRIGFVTVDGEPIGGFELTEAGTKKGLAIHVVTDLQDVPGIARLGIEPLSDAFTRQAFERICADAGRMHVKGMLRDQSRIAGIGNAYSDEILHAARLSPFQPTDALDDQQRTRLYECITATLHDGIEACTGTEPQGLKDVKRSHLAIHGRTGQACPTCGDLIREVSFADRSLQYCATCQTGGQPLADRRLSRLLK
jgi:formamidopyrimidine-DNA glycosylase